MRLYPTDHLRSRCAARGISIIAVYGCILRGRRYRDKEPLRWKYVRNGLTVIVTFGGEIVTAYRPGENCDE